MSIQPGRAAIVLALLFSASTACREDVTPLAPDLADAAATATIQLTGINMGGWHSCGIASDRRAYCWGLNGDGQLGDGTLVTRSRPTLVAGFHRFLQIEPSDRHTCGLTTDSLVYCWGQNDQGQLGIGVTGRRAKPTVVVGNRRYVKVNTGAFYSCALTTANKAFCWGRTARASWAMAARRGVWLRSRSRAV
jgi:alpha-tubulin suppressor-like RCC1 family protein